MVKNASDLHAVSALHEDAGEIRRDPIKRHDKASPERIPDIEERTAKEHAPVRDLGASGFNREDGQV